MYGHCKQYVVCTCEGKDDHSVWYLKVPAAVAHLGLRPYELVRWSGPGTVDVALSQHDSRWEGTVLRSELFYCSIGGKLLATELVARQRQNLEASCAVLLV
jgi:hypothetical protein